MCKGTDLLPKHLAPNDQRSGLSGFQGFRGQAFRHCGTLRFSGVKASGIRILEG